MTDKFSIIPLRQLVKIVFNQLENKKSLFGIPEHIFFKPDHDDPFRSIRFGQLLETPIGVAAGPHTQLAQNIVTAWICGARYMELKTVQTLDDLEVSKPCIDMQDEGYNCEWSQELKIHESYDQYLNAWILIHLLRHKFGWAKSNDLGTIFNMSVGYDLQGILKDNVQWFFDKMYDCSFEKDQKINEIRDLYPAIDEIRIPDRISDNVTLSTMHGCPPEEIEKIGLYLIEEKSLNTTIKLNPTLLGKEELHKMLNLSGFETQVPDEAFEHDLKYPDAIKIINNLHRSAKVNNVHFGLKLTNTLESINHKSVFPENEKMMYMSGRALHPIAINLTNKLQKEFNGSLDISFSAGVNAYNIDKVVACGLIPATVCSDILKPGGYGLLPQYLENLSTRINESNSENIDEYILTNGKSGSLNEAIQTALAEYANEVTKDKSYKRTSFIDPDIKTSRELKQFDCIQAPCVNTCPTNQHIPDYMYHVANGEFDEAFDVILRMNPFPGTTGMVCDHLCQNKCTRIHYDDSLLIREIKRFVAENGKESQSKISNPNQNRKKVAIIGAGPSGLSAGYFLAMAGFEVSIYEQKKQPGGMVSGAIPSFRLTNEAFKKDIDRIEKLGVSINYNVNITKDFFETIRSENNYIYIATGAQRSRKFVISGINSQGVMDPLHFLFDVKNGKKSELGKNVAIIGGGNTAMDAARTAYRLVGREGKVTILYRRTIKEMPADQGEIKAVLEEGMDIQELVLPVKVNTVNDKVKSLLCVRMKLQNSDSSGRPKPVEIPGSEFELPFDTVIPAIGQDLDIDFVDPRLLESDPETYETKIPNVFIGGDALRGASTAINAIGDGRKAAEKIIMKSGVDSRNQHELTREPMPIPDIMAKRMLRKEAGTPRELPLNDRKNFKLVSSTLSWEKAIEEASRCLLCDEVCNTCVTVCPNLALHSYEVEPVNWKLQKVVSENGKFKLTDDKTFSIEQSPQILHIADWCNECGNCTTFCPTSGEPYKIKPHLYLNKEAFERDDDCYYYDGDNGILLFKKKDRVHELKSTTNNLNYRLNDSEVIFDNQTFGIRSYTLSDQQQIEFSKAAEMRVVLEGVRDFMEHR